ncbi:MAG TPA: hypothetical protein VKJ47_21265 [Candidatus Binatia bacterium]|nr:hypothetical protein [Candidatus Binatia bacterium]
MTKRQPQRSAGRQPVPAPGRTRHPAAAGISNRRPAEEEHEQEQLPPRGQAKKKTAGGKG